MADTVPDVSKGEFDILRILWREGALSVREVHDQVNFRSGWAYTTTKTMMDRMVQKGLLVREEFHRVFIYRPLISRVQGLVKWVRFFSDQVLGTDLAKVVALFGENNSLTDQEIEELKTLLSEGEQND